MLLQKWSHLSQTLRTGIFVVLGLAVLLGAMFVLGAREQLFTKRYQIYAMYNDVAGLQEGAFVRIAGINVGTVAHISLPDSTSNRVRVTFNIRGDARRLIRADSKAIIDTEGLLGARIVIITQGSPDAAEVPPDGEILGQSPIQFHRFSQNIDRALENLDDVVLNSAATLASLSSIMAKIDAGRGSIGAIVNRTTLHDSLVATVGQAHRLLETTDELVRHIRSTTTELAGNVNEAVQRYGAVADTLRGVGAEFHRTGIAVASLAEGMQKGRGTLGRLIKDDSLYIALGRMAVSGDSMLRRASYAISEVSSAAHSIAHSAEQMRTTIAQVTGDIRQGRGTVGKLVTDDSMYIKLDHIMSNMEIASEKLAVNMEAVRTNWLFRGYFEEQGYWDNVQKKYVLQEQRAIRMREWEQQLLRLQAQLEAREQELDRRERRLRSPGTDTTRNPQRSGQ